MASKKSTPKFDPKLYAKRLGALYDDWKNPESQDVWKNIGVLVLTNGTPDEEIIYKKSTALQDWLVGFELENTVMVFTERGVHILTSKADLLGGIADARPADRSELSTALYPMEAGDNTQNFERLLAIIRDNLEGRGVGALPREAALGDFIEAWKKAFDDAAFTVVNAANAIGNLFSTKDEQEQKFVRTAGAISAAVLKNFVVPEIETIVDEEKKVTHSAVAEKIDDIFLTPSKINPKLTADLVESCYTPIIQSGGVYDLKPSAVSNDDQLHFGTIICSLGARYRHYCSNVARTYFVDPDKEQEEIYALLLEVHKLMIKALAPGNPVKKIMEVAVEHIQKKKPELVPHFVKTGGFGMGLEFRESALSITNKNAKVIHEGMVFNISPGFHNLERKGTVADPKKKVYSMMIADTVVVPASGEPKPLTSNAPSAWDDISYSVGDDDEAEEEEEDKPAAKSKGKGKEKKDSAAAGGRTSSRLRDDDAAAFGMRTTRARDADKNKKDMAAELRRKKHQEELEKKKREEAAARFGSKSKGDSGREGGAVVKEVMAYRSATEFPPEARNGRIHIDQKREAVLLPIYGMLVPFHISTIKNATKSEDYLRINFITPGSTLPNDKLPKVWKDGKATFIREMSFRCSDPKSLATSLRLINELRKRASLRAHDTHVRDSLVAQEELILTKGRPLALPDLYIRPTLGGRRSTGTLELHKNGFRFRSSKGGNVDIMFKNIKHAFFQPAENEVITIIHFHLWHPIMVGKKKTSDIQAYSEVMEIAQALDGRMPRGMEREEYDDENHEREQRAKMNADFQNFTKKVEDLVPDLEFDIPYRELGFFGVPGRTSTFLMPTVHCLVQLLEPPFFVLTLDEVDIAHFERVQFSLKNFDLVFVYKDLTRQPAFISAIPVQNLDPIKDWLDECNIKYYEGPANLNWKTILSTIREDPKKFWEDGGWNFLNTDGGSDDDASESEEEDAYNPSDQSDEEAAESESDAYSGSEEEDDDVSDDGDEEEDGEDSEEEGLDWDELEKRAAEEDKRVKYDDDVPQSRKRRRDDYSDDEDDRPKRSSSSASARGGSSARPAAGGARPAAGRSAASSSAARPSSSAAARGAGAATRKAAPNDPKRRRLDR